MAIVYPLLAGRADERGEHDGGDQNQHRRQPLARLGSRAHNSTILPARTYPLRLFMTATA